MSAASGFAMPTAAPFDSHRQWKIDHAGRIDKSVAKILIWVFASIAVISSILRVAFRLQHDRKIFAHDVFVVFGTLTLIPMTAVIYALLPRMYVVETVNSDPTVIFTLAELIELLDTPKWVFTYFALGWTTIFAIKFSFLVFFRQLVRNLSRWLEIYYWFSLVFTGASWIILAIEPAILCPHVGMAAIKCYPNTDYKTNLGLSAMTFTLDILTDLIIISFPATILSMSTMHLRQKLGIAVFLCLSASMVIITIVRLTGGLHKSARGHEEFSMTWTHLLLHVEACVAVLMGSVSAFRTVFVARATNRAGPWQISSLFRRYLNKLGLSSRSNKNTQESSLTGLGSESLPQAQKSGVTMNTLRRFIRRHNREPGTTTLASIGDSINDLEVGDYHDYRKREAEQLKVDCAHGWNRRQSDVHSSAAASHENEIPLSLFTKKSNRKP